jgi:hypothetical protein
VSHLRVYMPSYCYIQCCSCEVAATRFVLLLRENARQGGRRKFGRPAQLPRMRLHSHAKLIVTPRFVARAADLLLESRFVPETKPQLETIVAELNTTMAGQHVSPLFLGGANDRGQCIRMVGPSRCYVPKQKHLYIVCHKATSPSI